MPPITLTENNIALEWFAISALPYLRIEFLCKNSDCNIIAN